MNDAWLYDGVIIEIFGRLILSPIKPETTAGSRNLNCWYDGSIIDTSRHKIVYCNRVLNHPLVEKRYASIIFL